MNNEILTQVAKVVSESAEDVKSNLVNLMVERELNKRVATLDNAFAKLREVRSALNKIRPDNTTFNEDGSKAAETFSKARLDERNKAAERVKKLNARLDAAISLGTAESFAKLTEVLGK